MDNPNLAAPEIQRFGNDVAVAEPSSTNSQNYTVLSSDMAKQDYLSKQNWMNTEQTNMVNQSLQNQQTQKSALDISKERAAGQSQTDALKGATDALTGGSKTKTTSSGNSYNSTGDSFVDQLAAQNADNAAMQKQVADKLAIASTSTGLSISQQNQLTNLGSQWDSVIAQQQGVNNFSEASNQTSLTRSGADRYANQVATSVMTHVMNVGIQKIGELTGKKQQALDQMQQGFITDNVNAVNQAYKSYQDYSKQVTDNIKMMQDHISQVQTQQLNQQKLDLDKQQVQASFVKDNNIISPFYQLSGSPVVYDSKTGQQITSDQYAKMGGIGQGGKYQDIQQIAPIDNTKHSTAYTEWQDYASTGGKLSFNDYMNMDANRKATRVTNNTVTYNQAKDEAQTQASSTIGQTLTKLAGVDGYVSPEEYKKGLQKWVGAGYSAADFNKQFMNYLNPADVQDYGITK